MNSLINKENGYIAELKSLLQDKFFMLLLGISVSIVILSSVYSIIRPKDSQNVATNTNQTQKSADTETSDITADLDTVDSDRSGIEGIGEDSNDKSSTDVLSALKNMLSNDKDKSAQVTPAQAVVNAPNANKSTEYVVKQGDSLWTIAETTRGSGYAYVELAKLNNLTNADYIEVGQKLMIGKSQVVAQSKGEITDEAAMTKRSENVPKTYTVKSGDSLWSISVGILNNGYEWSRIASQNNIPNPDLIYPGQVIQLK